MSVPIRRLIFATGSAVIFGFSAFYLHQYYIHMPLDYALEWQYGHEQVVGAVKKIEGKYGKVVVSTSLDQPHIFFLYYLRYDPAKYQSEGGTISGKFDEERNAFGKYEFHSYMKTGIAKQNTLYIGTPSEVPTGIPIITSVQDPSGEVVYNIYGSTVK